MIYIAITEQLPIQTAGAISVLLEGNRGIASLYRLYWQKLTLAGLIHAAEPCKQSGISNSQNNRQEETHLQGPTQKSHLNAFLGGSKVPFLHP